MNIQDEDQKLVNVFSDRKMTIDSENASIYIKNIGYYKLKEYANPFVRDGLYYVLLFISVL